MKLKNLLDQSNLSMKHKGLVLVLVPLSSGLIFIVVLFLLLTQSEEARRKESHARTVIALANAVSSHTFDAVRYLVAYCMTGGDAAAEYYDRQINTLPKEVQELVKVTNDFPDEAKPVAEMSNGIQRASKLMNTMRHATESGCSPNDIWYLEGVRSHITSILQEFVVQQHTLIENVEKNRPATSSSDVVVRLRLKEALRVGIVIEIAMSLILVAFFSRTVTSRIRTLVDNAVRFRRREELNPTLSGSDELAQLDSAFHEMAKERNEAEEQIRESEARVRSIFESMPVALLVIDNNEKIESFNVRTEGMLGYSSEELLGKPLSKFIADASKNGSQNGDGLNPAKAIDQPIEIYLQRKNGELFPAELSASKLQMRAGPRLLVTMLDVTQRHEIEKLKQEFVNMISHDLKTPLTSIMGNLALVNADALGQLTERGKHLMGTSEKQALRLINMINELLLLEKMEAGGFELNLSETQISEAFAQALEAVGGAARQRSVSIEVPHTEIKILVDNARIVQVLINLLSNAVKFSPENGVVTVALEESAGDLEVRVRDQGRGIPEDHRKSIFEKFKQVEAADSHERGGTGLGLPICKLIVEKHGGTVGVDSREGKGSTFWFRLPKKSLVSR